MLITARKKLNLHIIAWIRCS